MQQAEDALQGDIRYPPTRGNNDARVGGAADETDDAVVLAQTKNNDDARVGGDEQQPKGNWHPGQERPDGTCTALKLTERKIRTQAKVPPGEGNVPAAALGNTAASSSSSAPAAQAEAVAEERGCNKGHFVLATHNKGDLKVARPLKHLDIEYNVASILCMQASVAI